MTKKKVIIIGSGISGLSSAYYLYKNFNVKIFEQNEYLGGHTHTHTIKINQESVNVDSGFIVFNNFNYKNFIQFIQRLKIKYQISNMSFSVINRQKKYEWSGKNFKSIFRELYLIFNIAPPQYCGFLIIVANAGAWLLVNQT